MGTGSSRRCFRRALGAISVVAAVGLATGCDYLVGSGSAKLDPDFGGGDGLVTLGAQTRAKEATLAAVFMPDGRVGVLAEVEGTIALMRFGVDGRLDPGFADGGVLRTGLNTIDEALAVYDNGAMALVEDRVDPISGAAIVQVHRYTPAGAPDPSFGDQGVVDLGLPPTDFGIRVVDGFVTDGDGLMVLTERPAPPTTPGPDETVLLRLGPDGLPDPAFGTSGSGAVVLDTHTPGTGGGGHLVARADGTFAVYTRRPVSRTQYVSAEGVLLATVPAPVPDAQVSTVREVVGAPDGSLFLASLPDPGQGLVNLVKLAPDGTLDAGFGTGGVAPAPIPVFLSVHLAVAGDGGVLVATDTFLGNTPTIFSTRVTPTGAVDQGYGDGGVASYPPTGPAEAAVALTATSAGATIVGSASRPPLNDSDILVLGITATGQLDTDFGDGGRALTDAGAAGEDTFRVVIPLPDGDIFVAGDNGALGDALIAGRYDADGSPDATHPPSRFFAGQLDARVPLAGTAAPDGSVFLVVQNADAVPNRSTFGGGSPSWRLVKFAPDGSLDTGFGDGGVVVHTELSYPNGVRVRPDGTILVAWTVVHPLSLGPGGELVPPTYDFKVGAFTPAGDPDTGFGTGGEILHPGAGAPAPAPNPVETGIRDILAVGPDNRAYVTAAGLESLDPAGTAFTPIAVPAGLGKPNDVVVDAQGRLLVVGTDAPPSTSRAATAVARFDASLALDPTFGTGGMAVLPAVQEGFRSVGPLLLADAAGAVTVVEDHQATQLPYRDLVIRRLHPNGTPDTGFSQDGLAQSAFMPGGQTAEVSDAALLGTDILVSGAIGTPAGDHDAYVVRINGRAPERSLPLR
jgi:uncharacterized delta-60 repeat protein